MTDTDAPESLPNYLADGLPKQDDDSLHDVWEYVDIVSGIQPVAKSTIEDK